MQTGINWLRLFCLASLLIGCGFENKQSERDYTDVFEASPVSQEVIDLVKLSDRLVFADGQQSFVGTSDGQISIQYKGTFSERKAREFLDVNNYVMRHAIFAPNNYPAGSSSSLGIVVVGVRDMYENEAGSSYIRKLDELSTQAATAIEKFSLNDGDCQLIRVRYEAQVYLTLVHVRYNSPELYPSYQQRRAFNVSEVEEEFAAAQCINLAHLFHLGISNLNEVQSQQVIQVGSAGDPIFPFLLKSTISALTRRGDMTGTPRKEFLKALVEYFNPKIESQ